MKKVLLVISLLISISCLPLHAHDSLRPRGDVNCDWEVNIADANALLDSIYSDAEYHALYSYATDVNGDKEINIADINMVIQSILGDEIPPMPTYSGTVPVLYINTEGYHNIDGKEKEDYLHAYWWLDNQGIEGYESLGSADNPLGMVIKGRGNYTWDNFDKKSYRIKLNEKQELMGMSSNRHFCLLAHADDHLAKLKNTIGFELSRRIGLTYTPAQEPVEVVLNGQYIGLYFLTEKPRVDKNRVNIEEQQNYETDPALITGGWMLELNDFDGPMIYVQEHYMDGPDWDDMLCFSVANVDALSQAQKNYLQQFLTDANVAIQIDDVTSTEWERYIDLDTLVRFYIVGEIMDDLEYFSGSLFMYKHRGEDTKLMFGPVWDFGNAFTRKPIFGVDSLCYFFYEQPTFSRAHWIQEMSKFNHFQQVLKECWQDFYGSDFNDMNLEQFIDDFVESIRPAIQANAQRWPDYDLDRQKNEFMQYINEKIAWLNTQWGDETP
jgi:hypothetical protein